jgi:hypothetical protein
MTKAISITVGIFVAALFLLAIAKDARVSGPDHRLKKTAAASELTGAAPVETPAAESAVIPAAFRPLNLALIRGGFTSTDEFFQRVQADPVLKSFYGTCSDPQATMKPLAEDVLVFSTFRRGDEIKWTRKPMLVHQGEYILTFCGKTVLARCANLISYSPMQPSEDVPPSLLEIPADSMTDPSLNVASSRDLAAAVLPVAAPFAPVSSGHRFFFIPPVYVPSGGGSSHVVVTPAVSPAATRGVSGDEFDGHEALSTLLAGFLAIALLKLATR